MNDIESSSKILWAALLEVKVEFLPKITKIAPRSGSESEILIDINLGCFIYQSTRSIELIHQIERQSE